MSIAVLPPIAGVDLADERRRHRDPRHAAQVRRRREAGDVGERTAAERDDGADRDRGVSSLQSRSSTCACFAASPGGSSCVETSRSPSASWARGAVDAHHRRVGDERDGAVAGHELAEPVERAELVVDAGRGERSTPSTSPLATTASATCAVERLPLVVQPAEHLLVLRERAVAALAAPPGRVDVDVEEHGERARRRAVVRVPERDRAAAERRGSSGGAAPTASPTTAASTRRNRLLAAAPRRSAGSSRVAPLDLPVDVENRPVEALRERARPSSSSPRP